MPWLLRVPGVRALYGDIGQTITRWIVAAAFITLGVIAAFGLLSSK
jgi:hypothetical protein